MINGKFRFSVLNPKRTHITHTQIKKTTKFCAKRTVLSLCELIQTNETAKGINRAKKKRANIYAKLQLGPCIFNCVTYLSAECIWRSKKSEVSHHTAPKKKLHLMSSPNVLTAVLAEKISTTLLLLQHLMLSARNVLKTTTEERNKRNITH